MPVRARKESLDRAGARLKDLCRTTAHSIYIDPSQEREIISGFERTYMAAAIDFTWMGTTLVTSPLDLWIYQEIVHDTSPDLIIATTENARYLAALCQMRGAGEVLWIGSEATVGDQERLRTVPDAVLPLASGLATDVARSGLSVLVVLGSSHHGHPVVDELRLYGSLVTTGSYLIVEGTGAALACAKDRAAALEDFLRQDPSFVIDRSREKFYLSTNEFGYLRRVSVGLPQCGHHR
ncbi:MAG: cephalosporin hydroxylase family protein [Actinomycetota bacterium]|nr:cephalosporin hydroxylase family protein [Actinomycetota bacterium]